MALRIGKKKQPDDWSEESLKQELASISEQDAAPAAAPVAESDDPLADLLNDPSFAASASVPVTSRERPSIPPPADVPMPMASPPFAPAAPLDASTPLAASPVKTPRKISPLMLAGGLVFLVVAGGAGVYFALFNKPAEDDSAPPPLPRRIARRETPPAPPAKNPAGVPGASTPKTTAPKPGGVKPGAPKIVPKPVVANTKPVASKTPIKIATPAGAKVPAVTPKKPGSAAPVVGNKGVAAAGVPVAVGPPPGLAGQPGKGSSRDTTVEVVRPVGKLTPVMQIQLKALWKKGADAKHRGNIAAARAAWVQMLRLRPGHPGVQDALNKLPK